MGIYMAKAICLDAFNNCVESVRKFTTIVALFACSLTSVHHVILTPPTPITTLLWAVVGIKQLVMSSCLCSFVATVMGDVRFSVLRTASFIAG